MGQAITFTIGRGRGCEIQLDDPSVSRRHAELVVAPGPVYYLTDCVSSYGTHVVRGGDWAAIRQAEIGRDDKVRFGNQVTTVREMLATAHRPAGVAPGTLVAIEPQQTDFDERPVGAVRRNPETGEIESLS